jgi:hypothetical protein
VGGEELPAECVVYPVDVLDVGARDHEHMRDVGRLTELIEERDRACGLMNDVRCAAPGNDFAENAGILDRARIRTRP